MRLSGSHPFSAPRLLQVYKYTGEGRYLEAIKAAARIEADVSRGVHTHFTCPTLIQVCMHPLWGQRPSVLP